MWWDRGIGHRLMESTMELFASCGTGHLAPFTFAHSPKHIVLYERFGFSPRFLIAVLEAAVAMPKEPVSYLCFSELAVRDRIGSPQRCASSPGRSSTVRREPGGRRRARPGTWRDSAR